MISKLSDFLNAFDISYQTCNYRIRLVMTIKNLKRTINYSQKGFTLIELIIVIAVIGIISTLFSVNFLGAKQRGRDQQRISDLKQIQTALEVYRLDNGEYPITTGSYYLNANPCPAKSPFPPSTGAYMQQIPCDPAGRNYYNNGNYYYYSSDGSKYLLAACLENGNDPIGSRGAPSPAPSNNNCSSGNWYYPISEFLTPTPTPTNAPTPTSQPTNTPTPTPALSYYQTVVNDGPVSYFRLADVFTNTAANVEGSPTGSYVNSPKQSQAGALVNSGDNNVSVLFNGTNQYINFAYSTVLSQPNSFSIEAWVYPTGNTGKYRGVVASRYWPKGWVLYGNSGNAWSFWINNSSTGMAALNGPSIQLNKWTYLVGTYDKNSTTASFYVNSTLVSQATVSSFTRNPQQPEAIGQGEPGSNFWFMGKIDEVAFYNKTLSQAQVTAHYNAAQ